jgi:NAD(P)-dependent dehydrogenase (short-subunit alcohol dehydrogenase family)
MFKGIITGASQGIGRALCSELPRFIDADILMVSRSTPSDLSELERKYPRSRFHHRRVDLSSASDLSEFCRHLRNERTPYHFLVNNAAIYADRAQPDGAPSILDVSPELFSQTLSINTIAPFGLIQAVLPMMLACNFGRIVNVTSGMSRQGEYDQRSPAYRASKRALNGVTLSTSHLVIGHNISCVSVCPGWVRTDMGGEKAIRSAKEGCLGVLWSLFCPNCSMNGKFFRDNRRLSLERTSEYDHFDLGPPSDYIHKIERRATIFCKKYGSIFRNAMPAESLLVK